jgi:hypothetical protein
VRRWSSVIVINMVNSQIVASSETGSVSANMVISPVVSNMVIQPRSRVFNSHSCANRGSTVEKSLVEDRLRLVRWSFSREIRSMVIPSSVSHRWSASLSSHAVMVTSLAVMPVGGQSGHSRAIGGQS